MSEQPADHRDGRQYEIRVDGHLAARWASRFDGFTLTRAGDGTTLIHGCGIDQSALHGLLRQLADLGLTLISVKPTGNAH